ncbi:MAG TPA: PAS domain S-box protein, partial [Vicinamibacterales bacterium]
LTIDEAPIGMALVALDGRFVRVNRALCEIVGYTATELTALSFQTITHPDDRERDLSAAGQLVRGEISRYQREKRYITKTGAIVEAMLNVSVLRDREGTPLYFISQIADITERKRAEAALKESEQRLNLALDSSRIGMWDLDLRTDTAVRSLRHDQIWGYSSPVPTWGKAIAFTQVVPEDLEIAQRAYDAAFTSGNFEQECRIRWPDESIHWISATGRLYRNEQGEPVRMMGTVTDITEKKRAEQQLRESEAQFSGIVSIAADAIISIDGEQRIIIFNSGAEQIFGYSKAEAIGMSLDRLIPERFRRIHRQHVQTFASGETTARRMGERLPIAGLRKNGEEFPAEAAISKLQVGEKTLLTVALRDITERKRIEDELTDANAYLDAIIENIPLMLFIKDGASLRFLRFNRAGEELLGWPREIFLGKTDSDFWPGEQAEFSVESDRETLITGKVVDIAEEPIQTREHGVRLVHTKKVPILDRTGQPTLLLGISEDITERRRSEKERQLLADVSVVLSASLDFESTLERIAGLLVENVADWCGVDVMEKNGRIRRLKVASADPARAPLCRLLEDMPPDRDLPHLMRSVVESRRPQVVEHVTPRYLVSLAQGPEHLQALVATGVTSFVVVPLLSAGQALGALFLGSSTPSREFGFGDLPLAEALADRLAMAVVNARLYQASVSASQLRDQMLGVVAHDLRNPLSTILLQAAALRRRGPEPERRSQKSENAIQRAARRMNRLINDLLDVGLLESGQLVIERTRLSPRELIAGAIELLTPLAASSSLDLRVDIDENVPELLGDRDRLLQVLENLIGNAIKFTEAGGSIVARASSGDHEVLFSVTDTGGGIAAEHLPFVFDRFWQATRVGRQGAGLGLAIAKGIVEAHGGRIGVESTQGHGTTFWFTIPRG